MKQKYIKWILLILAVFTVVVGIISSITSLLVVAGILFAISIVGFLWRRMIIRYKLQKNPQVKEQQVVSEKISPHEEVYKFNKELPGTGNILKFDNELIHISFKSKSENYVYSCQIRDISDWSFIEEGNVILQIDISQIPVSENIISNMRWLKKIPFKTNFEDVTWDKKYQDKRFRVKIFEKKISQEKKTA